MSSPETAGLLSSSPRNALPGDMEARPSRRWALRWAANGAAVVLAVPLALRLGMWVGSLASSTLLAVLPALLTFVVLPPLCVVGAERWLGHRLELGSMRLGAAVGVALGAQVLMLVGAVAAGVSARRLGDVALLTLVEAAVLPTVVALVARRSMASTSSPAKRSSP